MKGNYPSVVPNQEYTTGDPNVESLMVQYLDDKSFFRLCKTNKAIAKVCKNETIWQKRLLQRFPFFYSLKPEGINYKDYYLRTSSQIHKLLESLKMKGVVSSEKDFSNVIGEYLVKSEGKRASELRKFFSEKYALKHILESNKTELLKKTVKKGYLEIVRYFIEILEVIPESDILDHALQLRAIENGDLPLVKYFIEQRGADPHVADEGPLRVAAEKGHLPVVQYLIEEAKADPHVENETPIRIAVYNGYLPIVRYLVEKAKVDPRLNNDKLLKHAAYKGYIPIVQYLIEEAGADPHVDDGMPLHLAKKGQHESVVKYLESLKK